MYNSLSKLIIWICKRFTRDQIEKIIAGLVKILKDPNAEFQPKDTFRENHPNYRKFEVDPKAPLKEKDFKKKRHFFGKIF
jgi:hypothetical protein